MAIHNSVKVTKQLDRINPNSVGKTLWNSIDSQKHASSTQQQHKAAQLRSKQIHKLIN